MGILKRAMPAAVALAVISAITLVLWYSKLTMFGPGRKWHSANVSLNSSAVIQRCFSTMPRRANGSTPPKPATDIPANATNSSSSPGGGDVRISGAGTAAGGESGGIIEI